MGSGVWWVLLLYVFLVLPPVTALALSGKALSPVTYIPGETIINHYIIYGSNFPVKVQADGGIFKHVTITDLVNNEFDLIIDFPTEEHVPAGLYAIGLSVLEDAPPLAGIASQVAISKNIEVIVYSQEKDIRSSLNVPNINEGSNLSFQLGVTSVSYTDINEVHGLITFYNVLNKEVDSVVTEKRPLKSLSGTTFTNSLPDRSFSSGNYWAKAIVYYDGKQQVVNTTFLIGSMDILLKNYTIELQRGFTEFSVRIANNWGNTLRNVYARLFINGTEILQTPSRDLEPWEEGELQGIIKVNFPPGVYSGLLTVYFEGENKEFSLTLHVLGEEEKLPSLPIKEAEKKVQEAKAINLVPAIFVPFLLLVVLLLVLWRRRSRKKALKAEEVF